MPRNRRHRLTRLGWEVIGVVVAGSWALVAIAHALAGAKRALLLDDGDSVLLPLIVQSAARGEHLEWGMSPVLFVFPELPLYLASSAVTTSVAASLLVNGVVNVVLLYALLRFVAGRAASGRHPARPVPAALLGVAVFTAACLLETRQGGNTGEIASLYLTTTYYSGTVMALIAAVGLAMHTADVDPARRIRPALVALGVLAALATLSNPLFVLWAAAPLGLSLAVIAVARRRTGPATTTPASSWRRPLGTALVLVGGAGVGYLARQPLGRFVIADKNEYFRWSGQQVSLTFFRDAAVALVATPGGAVEAILAVLLLAFGVVVSVVRLGRSRTDATTLAAVFVSATIVVVPVGLLVTGSISTRYALPLVFAPMIALVVLAATARLPVAASKSATSMGRRRLLTIALVAALVVTVVAVVPAGSRVIGASRGAGDPGATCLADWSRGKDVTGVAQFWQGRGLAAYGGDSVHLLQVNSDFSVYPWLVNLAAYREARVSYVIVATGEIVGGHTEYWGDAVTDLGRPAAVVHCGTFDIEDFRGTPAEGALTERVDQSADVQAALRGFGW